MPLPLVGAGLGRTGTSSLQIALEQLLGAPCYERIFEVGPRQPPDDPGFGPLQHMVIEMFTRRFTPGWREEDTAKAAYEAHNDAARAATPSDRLLEWSPGDGWEPLCAALGVDVPSDPFPHANTTEEFRVIACFDEE